MYNPIKDLNVGGSVYCESIESDLIVSSIIYKGDDFAIVRFQCHDRFNCWYRLTYCYSSLAYGPHWIIDIESHDSIYGFENYWKVSNYIFEICVYS